MKKNLAELARNSYQPVVDKLYDIYFSLKLTVEENTAIYQAIEIIEGELEFLDEFQNNFKCLKD